MMAPTTPAARGGNQGVSQQEHEGGGAPEELVGRREPMHQQIPTPMPARLPQVSRMVLNRGSPVKRRRKKPSMPPAQPPGWPGVDSAPCSRNGTALAGQKAASRLGRVKMPISGTAVPGRRHTTERTRASMCMRYVGVRCPHGDLLTRGLFRVWLARDRVNGGEKNAPGGGA